MCKTLTILCIFYVLLSVIVDTGLGQTNEPLRCYFCRGMGPDNECEKFEPYKDAVDAADDGREHDGPVSLKTCTAPFNKSCMMETFTNNNGEIVHIRDCSDDLTFDFLEIKTNISSYKRLTSLHDNNETACTYDGQNLVCLSKCGPAENYTDFCNGPTLGGPRSTSFSVSLLLTILFVYVLLFP